MAPEFDVEFRLLPAGTSHDADRFTGNNPLSHRAVDPGQAGKKAMISLAVFDDQEFPISTEYSGINDAPFIRGHDLGPGGRLQ